MSKQLFTLIESKVDNALTKAAKRVADLRFFQQILARLQAGEDMSKQSVAFEAVDKPIALETIHALIKRCETDLEAGYWTYQGFDMISVDVHSTYDGQEAVPCYTVQYQIKTAYGLVIVNIKTSGATFDFKYDTNQCPKVERTIALDAASNQLMLAGLSNL
jgi:hypothetical protein